MTLVREKQRHTHTHTYTHIHTHTRNNPRKRTPSHTHRHIHNDPGQYRHTNAPHEPTHTKHTQPDTDTHTHTHTNTSNNERPSVQPTPETAPNSRSRDKLWQAYIHADTHNPMHEHPWKNDLDGSGKAVYRHCLWAATPLPHGMCTLIHDILRAQCSLGSGVYASPTQRYTGLTNMCPLFGALPQWGKKHQNTAPHNTEPTEPLPYTKVYIRTQMTTVNPSELPELLTTGDHSVIIVNKRDDYTSTTPRDTVTQWSTMPEHYADQGRGHMLVHWNKLRLRTGTNCTARSNPSKGLGVTSCPPSRTCIRMM